MYSTEQSVKQKQKIMLIIYEEQRHFLGILILCGFLGVVNVYQFNTVVIMQWTFYYET